MNTSRNGKKNKNAVVQYTEISSESEASANIGRKFEDEKTTSCEKLVPDNGVIDLSDCTLHAVNNDCLLDSSTEPAHTSKLHNVIDEDVTATSNQACKNDLWLDEKPGNVETYSWPRNIEEKAENDAFWSDYTASNARVAHAQTIPCQKSSGKQSAVWNQSVTMSQRKTDYNTDNRRSAFFKDNVDEPISMNYKQSSDNWNEIRKNKNATESKTNSSQEAKHGKSYSFKDMQASFVQDGNIPEAAAPLQNEAKDDVFQHPDWQFLDEYSEQTSTDMPSEPSSPGKPKRNKNVVSGSNFDGSNSSRQTPITVTGQSSSYKKKYLETSKTLGDLALEEGLVVKDVYPDGNCLFAAIVDQLHVRGEFYFSTRSLREAAVKYLTEHPYQEDGTPLKHFFTEHDGTWDQYLARMNRDGEWGDHFVISALANVLRRRLIIMRGLTKLSRTIMEPCKLSNTCEVTSPGENTTEASARPVLSGAGLAMGQGEVEKAVPLELDDLYLGHIAEAHYVSLRHYNWLEQFHDCLRRRNLPSFLHYGPCHEKEKESAMKDDNQEAEHMKQQTFPEEHWNFLLKNIQNAELFTPMVMITPPKNWQMCTVLYFDKYQCGLEAKIYGSKAVQKTTEQETDTCCYVVPNDTVVIVCEGEEESISQKDLVAKEIGCPHGFTLLSPVKDSLWMKATVKMNDQVYLKHLFNSGDTEFNKKLTLAFKCRWPKCTDEFLNRHRPNGWPQNSKLQAIQTNGVHVIAAASKESKHPDSEWKFSFRNAEKILCRGMGKQMKHVYYFLTTVHDFLFEDKDELNNRHLKAVFFYSCEELCQQEFDERPWHCLQYMLRKLETHLEERFLPDYFVRKENLIANMEEPVLLWHLAKLEWFQNNVVEGLFLLLDRCEVMELFGLRKYFETLITDAQKFVKHQNLSISYRECFLPLSISLIQTFVKDCRLMKANDLCDSIFEECSGYFDSFDGSQEILLKVLGGLPLQEQWLFAFYMDFMSGSNLLESVYTGRECVPLTTYFGKGLIHELEAISTGHVYSLNVPVTLVYKESLVAFGYSFTNMLLDIDKLSFKAAAHFFLKTFTKELLQDIAQEELNGEYHTGHADTKRKLYSMFQNLYNRYDQEKAWSMFQDLMEMYDLLSQHYQHLYLNQHVATLWEYFGDMEKYSVALCRLRSLHQ